MKEYLYLYLLFIALGSLSSALYCAVRGKELKKNAVSMAVLFSVIYYYVAVIARTVVGHGHDFLGSSFADKTLRAYIKVGVLEVFTFIAILIFIRIFGELGEKYIKLIIGTYAAFWLWYTVWVDIPRMKVSLIIGGIAGIFGTILFLLRNIKYVQYLTENTLSLKQKYMLLSVQILLFDVLFYLTGPTEMYAYNYAEFAFKYMDFIPYMFIFSLFLLIVPTVLICNYLPEKLFKVTYLLIFIYCILSYIQSMLLNGTMNEIEGVAQSWNMQFKVINMLVWIAVGCVLLILAAKIKKIDKIYHGAALYLIAVQIVTLVVVLISSDVLKAKTEQVVKEEIFSLAEGNNIIVFILDAYDVQMIQKVVDSDAAYLQALHDFTYYDNMESRYHSTDGSLSYLLTGVLPDKKEYETQELYDKSTFLRDINQRDYNIKILTDARYVEPFQTNYVDNYTDDFYSKLDFGKTVSQMSKCIRYRNASFAVKPYYQYESYDLTNMIKETNVYLFGTDYEFYDMLNAQGVVVDKSMINAIRIYHLFGAHCPYYLTENAELDYNSNPIAQWKGSLKIVYTYLEQLKAENLYDDATVIIMADHGLNKTQRAAMEEWNIPVNDKSNPIFFIKKSQEKHDALIVDSVHVFHDAFFPTIMQSIDSENYDYGKPIWEIE